MDEVMVYQREDDKWDWRLEAEGNHEQLCESLQGYETEQAARDGLERTRQAFVRGVDITSGTPEEVPSSWEDEVRPSEEAEVPDQQSSESS